MADPVTKDELNKVIGDQVKDTVKNLKEEEQKKQGWFGRKLNSSPGLTLFGTIVVGTGGTMAVAKGIGLIYDHFTSDKKEELQAALGHRSAGFRTRGMRRR